MIYDSVLIPDRPIAYHPELASLGAGVAGGVFLSQALYWTKRTKNKDGWFWKTRDEWYEETGMKRSELDTARRKLRNIGVIEEDLRGVPARKYYRIDLDKLVHLLKGGKPEPITLEELIEGSHMARMSRSAKYRAEQAGVEVHNVDYSDVLREKGLICGICKEAIVYGIAQTTKGLCFDHIVPLSKGGGHTIENIQPAHYGCNALKHNGDPTSLRMYDQLDGGCETNKTDSVEPTITESTTETTPETTSPCAADAPHDETGAAVNRLIAAFEPINPSYKRFYPNKTQRGALQRLVEQWGEEAMLGIIRFLPQTNAKKYAPTITTPLQLEGKLGALKAYCDKIKDTSNSKKTREIIGL